MTRICRCGARVDGRCEDCTRRTQRVITRRRGSAGRFYSTAAWTRLRAHKIARDPLCEVCLAEGRTEAATEVDHIVPIDVDWGRRLDITNLQSLSRSCHARKTAADKRTAGG